MSSFPRRLQRKAARKNPDYETPSQPTVMREDGGYKTLRPTGGWLDVSILRMVAQFKLAAILERAYVPTGRTRKPSKVWRTPAPATPSTETRQQRRAAARA